MFSGSKANFAKWAASRPRAKAGGETIGGTFFKGGQFVSNEAIAAHLGIDIQVVNQIPKDVMQQKLGKAIERAKAGSLSSMAYIVRKEIVGSIKQRKDKDKASPAGTPPYQHKPGFLKGAARYAVDKTREDAVIGFMFSRVGRTMKTHEKGLREGRRSYPERRTVEPALERSVVHFAPDWRSSVG